MNGDKPDASSLDSAIAVVDAQDVESAVDSRRRYCQHRSKDTYPYASQRSRWMLAFAKCMVRVFFFLMQLSGQHGELHQGGRSRERGRFHEVVKMRENKM